MTDLNEMLEFIANVLREAHDPQVMRQMLRKEYSRLSKEFSRLEDEMMKEAA
jgi:hypothetical protein